MSKTTRNILISVIGVVTILGTYFVMYLLDFFKTDVNILSVCFLIFAETLLFISIFANIGIAVKTYTMQKVGLPSVATLYIMGTALALVLFKISEQNAPVKFNTALAIYIALTLLMIVIATAIIYFSDRTNKSNKKIIEDRRLMQICEKRIYDLTTKSENKDYADKLNKIYESIKYADKTGASSVDEKIVGAIMKLENEIATDGTTDIFENINSLISQRNMEIAETKRGGF